jgi:hypothetical protein
MVGNIHLKGSTPLTAVYMEHEKKNFNNRGTGNVLSARNVLSDYFRSMGLLRYAVRLFSWLAGIAVIAILPSVVLADYGNITYTSSTPGSVTNIGQSFTFVTGDITGIRVSNPPSGELQLRPCSSGIDSFSYFHKDIVLNDICSGGPMWKAASSTLLASNDYLYTFASSSLATSTYSLSNSRVYAIVWSGTTGMNCRPHDDSYVPVGNIFSIGSPNTNDDTGGCEIFPTVLVNATLETAPTSTLPSLATLDIPSNGQLIEDFKYWTVSAMTSHPNSTLRVLFYDDFGGYYNQTINADFSNFTLTQANYEKIQPLHHGTWHASAQIYNPNLGVLYAAPFISFSIATSTDFAPSSISQCNSTSSYSVWNITDWKCAIFGMVGEGYTSIKNTFYAGGGAIKNLIANTFPVSVFYQVNNALDIVASSTPTSTPPIIIPGFHIGKNITLISTSTIAQASTATGKDLRGIITAVVWFVVGILVIGQAVLLIFVIMTANKND